MGVKSLVKGGGRPETVFKGGIKDGDIFGGHLVEYLFDAQVDNIALGRYAHDLFEYSGKVFR
jgi:hypothetical protein